MKMKTLRLARAWILYYVVCVLMWLERPVHVIALSSPAAGDLFSPGDVVYAGDSGSMKVVRIVGPFLECVKLTWHDRLWLTVKYGVRRWLPTAVLAMAVVAMVAIMVWAINAAVAW